MAKPIDISGKKFGRLTAVAYHGDSKWLCKCECGNETVVKYCNLKNGHTKSCGCIAKETSADNGRRMLDDIKGKRFGNLVCIEYMYDIKKWKCRCDCGNVCYVAQSSLRAKSKGTTSCGCKVSLQKANLENIVTGTNVGNIRSQKISRRNKTGIRGVYQDCTGKYVATIGFQGKQYTLKRSDDINVCIQARKEAEDRIFGDFLKWLDETREKESKKESNHTAK